MENCGNTGKGRPAQGEGVRCRLCGNPTYYVCENCSEVTFNCPRSDQQAGLPKGCEEDKVHGAVGNSGSSLLGILREGSKMLGRVTRNVASATDQLFGVQEEDIDRVVEEFKKAQLEAQEQAKK